MYRPVARNLGLARFQSCANLPQSQKFDFQHGLTAVDFPPLFP